MNHVMSFGMAFVSLNDQTQIGQAVVFAWLWRSAVPWTSRNPGMSERCRCCNRLRLTLFSLDYPLSFLVFRFVCSIVDAMSDGTENTSTAKTRPKRHDVTSIHLGTNAHDLDQYDKRTCEKYVATLMHSSKTRS